MQERRVSESGYLKTSLMAIASAVERMVLPVDPNFEKDQTNDAENLIIHDRLIPNPFSLKSANNFNSPPLFGLFDLPPMHWLRLAWARCLQVIWRLSLIQWWLCRIFSNCSVESRGCPCLCSQSAASHENENGWRKAEERSTTISGLFLRVEAQTEVVYFRQDASVKVVEMGDVWTLRPQCMQWTGKLNS